MRFSLFLVIFTIFATPALAQQSKEALLAIYGPAERIETLEVKRIVIWHYPGGKRFIFKDGALQSEDLRPTVISKPPVHKRTRRARKQELRAQAEIKTVRSILQELAERSEKDQGAKGNNQVQGFETNTLEMHSEERN